MPQNYAAVKGTTINAPASKVWEALTTPDLAKQFLFGTEVTADWRVGGQITYRGVWEGNAYEDKGTILTFAPNKILRSTHFSSLSGKEDKPENYHTVTYELAEGDGQTTVTITQDNNATQEEADHAAENWGMILDNLKKLLESPQ